MLSVLPTSPSSSQRRLRSAGGRPYDQGRWPALSPRTPSSASAAQRSALLAAPLLRALMDPNRGAEQFANARLSELSEDNDPIGVRALAVVIYAPARGCLRELL